MGSFEENLNYQRKHLNQMHILLLVGTYQLTPHCQRLDAGYIKWCSESQLSRSHWSFCTAGYLHTPDLHAFRCLDTAGITRHVQAFSVNKIKSC